MSLNPEPNPEPPYQFLREIRGGSSLPIVVRDAMGADYLVKPRGAGGGAMSGLCEWFAWALGILLNIPMLAPRIVRGEDINWMEPIDPEISELITRSHGANLAFAFDAHARGAEPADIANRREVADRIFLFALFLLNIDRLSNNLNLLWTADNLKAHDYEAAFTIRGALENKIPTTSPAILRELRRSPLYHSRPAADEFIRDLRRISADQIVEGTRNMPREWISESPRPSADPDTDTGANAEIERIAACLGEYAQRGGGIKEGLEALRETIPETAEERRIRQKGNQEAARQKGIQL